MTTCLVKECWELEMCGVKCVDKEGDGGGCGPLSSITMKCRVKAPVVAKVEEEIGWAGMEVMSYGVSAASAVQTDEPS